MPPSTMTERQQKWFASVIETMKAEVLKIEGVQL